MDILKNKYVLEGLAGFAVLCLGFYLWTTSGSTPLLSESQASPVSQELIATLGKLHTITLDQTVFSDPVFVSLNDFGVTIPPEATGRRNPFAPVGAATGTTTAR